MNKKFNYKTVYILVVLLFFFFTSLQIYYNREQKKEYQPTIEKTLKEIPLTFNLSSLEKLHAANENQWDGIRAAISLVRDITNGIDSILLGFKRSGLFNRTGTFTTNNGIFKIKLVMNNPESISLTAGGTKEFSNKLILWNASTNAKYMELYFDDPESATSDGAAITFEPAVMDSVNFNTGKRMECYTNLPSKTMTCSWEGKLDKINGITEKAQIIVKEENGVITLNGLIKTDVGVSNNIQTLLGGCDEGGSRYYYTLLAVIKNTAPYFTTAAYGAREDLKSLQLGNCPNSFNYGYFNTNANPNATDSTKFFAGMGTSPPSSDYPTTADVDALLTQEPSKTTVDGVTVSFKSTDTAP